MTKEGNKTIPFPGLRPYKESESDIFFSREREVEDALSILKRYKLVTICGESGTGKSSLIHAGILPKLRKGFMGQSGKDWVICDFRPGISPIENLSYALSESGSLYLNSKAKNTDHQNYKSVLENKGDLGLIDLFGASEIYEKKNLLIVIDQLEDLFKYPDLFSSEDSNNDDLLFDLVYRSSRYKQASIYFILAIDTEFIGKLNSYDRFTEILNHTQFNLPHLGGAGLEAICKNTLHKKNIQFSDEVLDQMADALKDNPSVLTTIQFFLKRVYEAYSGTMTNEIVYLDAEKIKEFGGFEITFENYAESFYEDLDETDKRNFELLMRSLFSGKPDHATLFYQTIDYNINLLKIDIEEITAIVKKIKEAFGDTLDVFKSIIRGLPIEQQKKLSSNDLLCLKYQSILKWDRLLKWKSNEDENYEIYEENFTKARKYPAESLLTATSLKTAVSWLKDDLISEEWSKKYSFDFHKTSEYITKSKKANALQLKKEEEIKTNLIKSKKRNRAILYTLVSFAFVFLGILYSVRHKQALKLQAEKALVSQEKEKVDSLYNDLNALILKDSVSNAERIKEQRLRLELAQSQLMSQQKLIQLKNQNEKQNELIEAKREKIFNDSIAADGLMNLALFESQKAKASQRFIDLKDSLSLLLYTLNNTTLNTYDKIIFNKITKQSIDYYEELKALGENLGRDYDDDNLRQISVNLVAKLNGENQYSNIGKYDLIKENTLPLNAINISANGKIASGGVSRILYSSDKSISLGIQPLERITEFPATINALEYLTENFITVGLDNSEIWLVNLKNKEKQRIFQINDWKPGKLLKKSINKFGALKTEFNKEFFKGIGFLEYNSKTNKLYATIEKSLIEIDVAKINNGEKEFINTITIDKLEDEEFITSMAFSDLANSVLMATNQGNVIVRLLNYNLVTKLSNEYLKMQNETAIEIEFYADKVLIGTSEGSVYLYRFEKNKLEFIGSKRANNSRIHDLLYNGENIYALSNDGSITIIEESSFINAINNTKAKTPVRISLGNQNYGNAIESFSYNKVNYFITADHVGNLVYWDLDLSNTFKEIKRLFEEKK